MNHVAAACRAPRLRSLLVWATITALCAALLAATLQGVLVPQTTRGDFSGLVLQVAASGALAASGVLWIIGTRVLLDVWRGRVGGPAGTARRLLLLACGVTTAAALTCPPVQAHQGGEAPPLSLAGLPLPDRPVGHAPPPQQHADGGTVVVRAGDSLWSIAARTVATTSATPGASEGDVASYWRRLVELNRPTLGDDPDLIHPGLRLQLPHPPRSEP